MMEPRLGGGGSSCRANAQPGAGPAPNVARCPFPDNASSSRPANECQASNWNENPGDRFDNAADYSQLLRSFGELAAELVDLGFCCLLAQSFDSAALGLDNLICRAAEPGGHFRRLAEQVGPRCVLRELEALARQELTANAPVALLAPESLQFARTKIVSESNPFESRFLPCHKSLRPAILHFLCRLSHSSLNFCLARVMQRPENGRLRLSALFPAASSLAHSRQSEPLRSSRRQMPVAVESPETSDRPII